MGANRSDRAIHYAVMSAQVAEYAAWELLVVCVPCQKQRSLSVAALPQDIEMAAAVRRLRCSRCRRHPTLVSIDNGLTGWRARTIVLWKFDPAPQPSR